MLLKDGHFVSNLRRERDYRPSPRRRGRWRRRKASQHAALSEDVNDLRLALETGAEVGQFGLQRVAFGGPPLRRRTAGAVHVGAGVALQVVEMFEKHVALRHQFVSLLLQGG